MARPTNITLCSFCGKSHAEVKKLIAGPTVYICDECIGLCNDIIAEAREQEDVPAMASKPERTKRQKNTDPTRTAQQVNPNGQVDVEAPRGVPVQPKQKPSRKFFPTNEGPAPAPPPQPQSIFDAIFR